jgi:hypothetical protein
VEIAVNAPSLMISLLLSESWCGLNYYLFVLYPLAYFAEAKMISNGWPVERGTLYGFMTVPFSLLRPSFWKSDEVTSKHNTSLMPTLNNAHLILEKVVAGRHSSAVIRSSPENLHCCNKLKHVCLSVKSGSQHFFHVIARL